MRKLVLWGHDLDEYQSMFDWEIKKTSQLKILEFGCGASAVNAQLTARGIYAVSIDQLYCADENILHSRVMDAFNERVKELLHHPLQLNTEEYGGLEAFIQKRREGCEIFFQNYAAALSQNRYLQKLPDSFSEGMFDCVFSSHYFFSGQDLGAVDEHVQQLLALTRVAQEIRIFPLIDYQGEPSPLLGPVMLNLQQAQCGLEVRKVKHTLYPQGNAMLRIWPQVCHI